MIRVTDLPCKVVATLQPKGQSLSGQDQDDTIILPYTTAQKKIKGITWLGCASNLWVGSQNQPVARDSQNSSQRLLSW